MHALSPMAPQQRLLHAALGIARDVASKSNVAAGGCSQLRERIASRSLGFAAGRHTACASIRSKDGRAGAWATQPTTTDVLAGQLLLLAALHPSSFPGFSLFLSCVSGYKLLASCWYVRGGHLGMQAQWLSCRVPSDSHAAVILLAPSACATQHHAVACICPGWKARIGASSFVSSSARRSADTSSSRSDSGHDGDESVINSESSASDGATAASLPSLPRR